MQLRNLVLLCVFFLSINLASKSYNSLGQVGLINLPTAEIMEEQSIFFTFKRDTYTKLGTLTVTPFDWLEASYFYYRPDDTYWGNKLGSNLDKGFNVKFSYKPENVYLPRISVGLDDFSGTGKFTKEYLVSTYNFQKVTITTGIGWGKFVGDNSISNPLGLISEKFDSRPITSSNYDKGGTPSYDKWFRGDAVLFAGLEIPIDRQNKISLKIESNPFDYYSFGEGIFSEESFSLRNSKSDVNFGLSYKFNKHGNLDFSYVKGDTFSLSISFGLSFKENLRTKKDFKPVIKDTNYKYANKYEFYNDLLENLNNNKLYLQSANLDENKLKITIDSEEINNPVQSTSRAAFISHKILLNNNFTNINEISVGNLTRGIQINNITYRSSDLNKKNFKVLVKERTANEKPHFTDYEGHEFKPRVPFPIFLYSIEPDVRLHLGSPERFQFSGLGIALATEVQFSRNLSFNSIIAQDFYNTFDKKVSRPDSGIAKVRTEIVDYLQKSDDLNFRIFQFDYIVPIKNKFVTRISAGYLEQMYGGFSSELLYKSFHNNYALSLEVNSVKKRNYDGRFSFLDYETTTAHVNSAYYHPKTNILFKLSYGKYLAGDKGYTFDISRRMPSGWQAGVYFTRTNLSAEDFGEGSFDKGFYFKIPLNRIQKSYTKQSTGFSLNSITRDGGQKLVIQNKLIDSFYGSSYSEINENWRDFLR